MFSGGRDLGILRLSYFIFKKYAKRLFADLHFFGTGDRVPARCDRGSQDDPSSSAVFDKAGNLPMRYKAVV